MTIPRLRSLSVAAAVPASVALVLASPGTALAAGPSNGVDVANSSGTHVQDHVQVTFTSGNNFSPANEATAYSHDCTGCHTRAVAIQVVVATSPMTNAAPSNQAYAVNYQCKTCDSFAFARQFAIQASSGAHLTPAANNQISQIEQQIDADTHDLSIDDEPVQESDGTTGPSVLHDDMEQLYQQLITAVQDGLTD